MLYIHLTWTHICLASGAYIKEWLNKANKGWHQKSFWIKKLFSEFPNKKVSEKFAVIWHTNCKPWTEQNKTHLQNVKRPSSSSVSIDPIFLPCNEPHVCEELNEANSYALLILLFMNVFKKKKKIDTTRKTGED